jgi:hypothetical protein
MKVSGKSVQQAVVAREVIDLYLDSEGKREIAESLDVLCFAMARLTDCDKVDYPPVDWDDLAALFDMIAFSEYSDDNRCAVEKDMDVVYRKTLRVIEAAKLG